jgi:glycosyltransferase involved in cell wall biosynthesis
VIIRSNSISYDPRVLKLSNSLSKNHTVLVLGWNRENQKSSLEHSGALTFKTLKIPAPYGNALLIAFFPIFWLWTFLNLLRFHPKIVHACDLDCLIPALIYGKIFSEKVVFDSFDRYAMAFIPKKYPILYAVIDNLENILAYFTDALVTVSEERLRTFRLNKNQFRCIIANCPSKTKNFEIEHFSNNTFRIVYAGSLAKDRGISILLDVIDKLNNVDLFLAGRADDGLIQQIKGKQNIHYVGQLSYNNALRLQASADVIPILYDPSIPINTLASPNKLFEAMMLRVPVITNVCSELLKEAGCGILVAYDCEPVLSALALLLKDTSLRSELGDNGYRAFTEKYNWALMEGTLLNLYSALLKSNPEKCV